MLTSLSFLDPGEQWPPPEEAERLDKYAAHRLLFEGRHEHVFNDWWRLLRQDNNASLELILNWPKRLSTLWADLLLGEPPAFTSDEQERLDELIRRTHFVSVLYDAALDVSRYGDAVLKVRREDGKAVIETVSPAYWFPVVSISNARKVEKHVLAWVYKKTEGTLRKGVVEYLKAEIHSPGLIEHKVYRLANSRIRNEVSLKTDFPKLQQRDVTGRDGFLVFQLPGLRSSDRLFGLDDYSDIEGILQEMEVRLAQTSRVLDKHADPNMYGPPVETAIDPRTGLPAVQTGRYFPIEEDMAPPGYITWEGQLAASYKELEVLMEQFYLISETTPAAFGQLKAGLAESGSALKRLMQAPLAKVSRLRTRMDPVIKDALLAAASMEDGFDLPPLETVDISWNDGLPDDPKEQSDIEEQRINSGTTSRHSAIKRLDGVDDDGADAEMQRIFEETPVSSPLGDLNKLLS